MKPLYCAALYKGFPMQTPFFWLRLTVRLALISALANTFLPSAFASQLNLSRSYVLVIQGSAEHWADRATREIEKVFKSLAGFDASHFQKITPYETSAELEHEIAQNEHQYQDLKDRSRSIKYYRAAIQRLTRLSDQNASHLLVFLLGHGASCLENYRQGASVEMIVQQGDKKTKDLIRSMEFYKELEALPKEMVKALVTESCYGGGFAVDFGAVPNLIIMTSSPTDDYAYYFNYPAEPRKPEFYMSRYLFWWLSAFKGRTITEIDEAVPADLDRDGALTYAEIHLSAMKNVNRALRPEETAKNQSPMLFTTGWNTGDLSFGETNPYSRSVMSPQEWRETHKKFLQQIAEPQHQQYPADINQSKNVDAEDVRYLATMLSGIVGYPQKSQQDAPLGGWGGFTEAEYFLPRNRSKELQLFNCDGHECVDRRDLLWLVENMDLCWKHPQDLCEIKENSQIELWRMRIEHEHELGEIFLKSAHDELTQYLAETEQQITADLFAERQHGGQLAGSSYIRNARSLLKLFELRLLQAARLKLSFAEYRQSYYDYYVKYWELRARLALP